MVCLVLVTIFTRETDTLKVDDGAENDLGVCATYPLTPITIVLIGCIGNILSQVYIFGKDAVARTLQELIGPLFDSLAGRTQVSIEFEDGNVSPWGVEVEDDWTISKIHNDRRFDQ